MQTEEGKKIVAELERRAKAFLGRGKGMKSARPPDDVDVTVTEALRGPVVKAIRETVNGAVIGVVRAMGVAVDKAADRAMNEWLSESVFEP